MVSKTRVVLVMLPITLVTVALAVLLAARGADAAWIKIFIPGFLGLGVVLAQSFGWFDKQVPPGEQ
ncbi:ABC-type nitrate/sulfonate/bicarbonate transport system substrate-binding protein [Actinoplanes lutulentus]|uniref:Uncharacterized protein n=1 Tax=Actinoplanes lutulentus TaxID=1287878 RepID=A0A327YXS5_9ACTN|nr:hypothetical protein [Actinoplanes lutulentus]MBB2949017.1 ABC-type nitrate/sulfonate/bicarbonate transport system substrate-binding protein [Actinoplanes lutulentus]RAK26205.1 hypothetical protein B0I29_12837 [Actinoplanes lutulentus]